MTDEQKYLDYVNNFLTIAAFAEHYGMTNEQATTLVNTQRNMGIIENNIGKAIAKAKRDQITGMSMDNLFQVTQTDDVTCPVSGYRPLFEQLVPKVAKKRKFQILK